MNQIVKIFGVNGKRLEKAVNKFMDDFAESDETLGTLNIFGVTALDIQKIGGIAETEIWVTFDIEPMGEYEGRLMELNR